MRYQLLLLDADDTLFDFKQAEHAAILKLCQTHHLEPADEIAALYSRINQALWKRLERGELTQQALRVLRFQQLSEALQTGLDAELLNREYSAALSEGAYLIDGALSLCRTLSQILPLYIVTNGILDIQTSRLARSPLGPYISGMFVSQQIGYAKPDPEYFRIVLERLGNPDKHRILLVGDSLTSDMKGGRQAGIATCWFAPDGGSPSPDCDYQIRRLQDLIPLVTGK